MKDKIAISFKRKMFFMVILILTLILFVAMLEIALRNLTTEDGYIMNIPLVPLFYEKRIKKIEEQIKSKNTYIILDPFLGWTIRPNSYSSNKKYHSNSQGIRANKDYKIKESGYLRIATFGDSTCHCDGVYNNETWQYFLESYFKNVEIINFGVGGYGTDQAFLRYKYLGRKFKPKLFL
jgi:hypothetical protein